MPEAPDAARERMAHAEEKLAEAERLLEAGFLDAAAHAAYYAAFHAALSMLATAGSAPRTHRGVISEIGRLFVQTKRMPKDAAAMLEQALDTRMKADYGVLTPISIEEAKETVAAARGFLNAARKAAPT